MMLSCQESHDSKENGWACAPLPCVPRSGITDLRLSVLLLSRCLTAIDHLRCVTVRNAICCCLSLRQCPFAQHGRPLPRLVLLFASFSALVVKACMPRLISVAPAPAPQDRCMLSLSLSLFPLTISTTSRLALLVHKSLIACFRLSTFTSAPSYLSNKDPRTPQSTFLRHPSTVTVAVKA
jgi:hypothetical protein